MHWTEPATADDSHADLEKKLWDAANQLWAGASLKPSDRRLKNWSKLSERI